MKQVPVIGPAHKKLTNIIQLWMLNKMDGFRVILNNLKFPEFDKTRFIARKPAN